jgi:hypothetical protein
VWSETIAKPPVLMCLIIHNEVVWRSEVQFLSDLMLAIEEDYAELHTQNALCLWAEFMVHVHCI